MLFLGKKKIVEVENKLDLILNQLNIVNKEHEQILNVLSKMETRIDQLEEIIQNNNKSISEHIEENSIRSQEKYIAVLHEAVEEASKRIQGQILNTEEVNSEKLATLTHELEEKTDLMDSSLRLLLLNSVLNQADRTIGE